MASTATTTPTAAQPPTAPTTATTATTATATAGSGAGCGAGAGAENSAKALSITEQYERFLRVAQESRALIQHDVWYAVEKGWYESLHAYWTSIDGGVATKPAPGPLDNSSIANDDGTLKLGLESGKHFVQVSARVFELLQSWFGASPAISGVVQVLAPKYVAFVEFYAGETSVFPCDPAGQPVITEALTLPVGRSATVEVVVAYCCKELLKAKVKSAVDPDRARLWLRIQDGDSLKFTLAPKPDQPINMVGEAPITGLMLETATRPGKWARSNSTTSIDGTEEEPAAEEEKPIDPAVFRAELKVGDRCDAEDDQHNWYEGEIVEVSSNIKVHYRTWLHRYDATFPRQTPSIMPCFTKINNFRAELKPGVHVELNTKTASKPWREAAVAAIDGANVTLKCKDVAGGSITLDVDDERIAELGTHMPTHPRKGNRRTDQAAARTAARGAGGVRNAFADESGNPLTTGIVGQRNLGNTCYMNSVLQCLSNTEPLANFFLTDEYKKDVNKDNFLGHEGKLAEEYAKLVKRVWSGKYSTVVPRDFKALIGQYNEEFAGFSQHDAHNLLQWLLDGLLEDLCEVKEKRKGSPPEDPTLTDMEAANASWEFEMDRKRSVITRLFYGQTKEVHECNVCGEVTRLFQGMLNLEVRVSLQSYRKCMILYYDYEGSRAVRYDAVVDDGANFGEVKVWVEENLGFPRDELVFCTTLRGSFSSFCIDTTSVATVPKGAFIMCYRVPAAPAPPAVPAVKDAEADNADGDSKVADESKVVEAPTEKPDPTCLQSLTPHCAGVTILMMRHPDDSRYYYHRNARKPWKPLPDPALLSLYALSGEHGKMPTNNQVHDLVFAKMKRILHPKAIEKEIPYTLGVQDLAHIPEDAEPIPHDDEPLVIDHANAAIVIDFTTKQLNSAWNKVASVDVDKDHESVKAELPKEPDEIELTTERLAKEAERVQLSGANTVYCEKCKDLVRAYTATTYVRLPDYMVIHLGRFRTEGVLHAETKKLDTLVKFPITGLDMSPYLAAAAVQEEAPPMYDLYGIVNHVGSLHGGHYTAMVKSVSNDKWYDISDNFVMEMPDTSKLVTRKAYLLFYRRRLPGQHAPVQVGSVAAAAGAGTGSGATEDADDAPAAAAAGDAGDAGDAAAGDAGAATTGAGEGAGAATA